MSDEQQTLNFVEAPGGADIKQKPRGRGCKRKVDDDEDDKDDDYVPDTKKPKTKTQKKNNAEKTKKTRKEDPVAVLKKQIKDGKDAAAKILNAQHAANKIQLEALAAQALATQLLIVATAQRAEHSKFDVFTQKSTLADFIRLGQTDAPDTPMAEAKPKVVVEPDSPKLTALPATQPATQPAKPAAKKTKAKKPAAPVVQNPVVSEFIAPFKPENLSMPEDDVAIAELHIETKCYFCKGDAAGDCFLCENPQCLLAGHVQCALKRKIKFCPSCIRPITFPIEGVAV